MIEAREGLFQAVPLDVGGNPTKLSYILDRLVEHETEWSDFQKGRRDIASSALAEHYTSPAVRIFEVWRTDEPQLCGLLAFTHIVPQVGAEFHPVFFDGALSNLHGKRELLLRAMDWVFQSYTLHRLGMEVPETAPALINYARKKLGFRFEAEGRRIAEHRRIKHGHIWKSHWPSVTPTEREASYGSRRHQALYKDGQWRDVILLSVTVDEFQGFVREAPCRSFSIDPAPSRPSPAILPDFGNPSSLSSVDQAPEAPVAPLEVSPES